MKNTVANDETETNENDENDENENENDQHHDNDKLSVAVEPQSVNDEKKFQNLYETLENATDSSSLLKKYLTSQIFDKLKNQKTEQGCTLQSCIQSGIDNLDSGVGVYA
eukprot:467394_1